MHSKKKLTTTPTKPVNIRKIRRISSESLSRKELLSYKLLTYQNLFIPEILSKILNEKSRKICLEGLENPTTKFSEKLIVRLNQNFQLLLSNKKISSDLVLLKNFLN